MDLTLFPFIRPGGLASGGSSPVIKQEISGFAIGGDSLIYGMTVDKYGTQAGGFATWIRIFCGSEFDFVPGATALAHGLGGLSSTQFRNDGYLDDMIAADAPVDVFGVGTNDQGNGISIATTVANLQACCEASVAALHRPIVLAIPPLPLSVSGNAAGAMSADTVLRNQAIATMCAAEGYELIDQTSSVSVSPGVMAEQFAFAPGNLHFSSLGALTYGRALAGSFRSKFEFTVDPLANTSSITPNSNFALVTTGRPNGYSLFVDSDTVNESTSGGVWTINMTSQSDLGEWLLWNQTANVGGSPAGKTVDGLLRFQITQGSFIFTTFTVENASRARVIAGECMYNSSSQILRSGPATYVYRTPPNVAAAGGDTLAAPYFYFGPGEASNCTIKILNCEVREY